MGRFESNTTPARATAVIISVRRSTATSHHHHRSSALLHLCRELIKTKRISFLLKLNRSVPLGTTPLRCTSKRPVRFEPVGPHNLVHLLVSTSIHFRIRILLWPVQCRKSMLSSEQTLFIHVILIIGLETRIHSFHLVEQPLIIHNLPSFRSSRRSRPERDFLADVTISISSNLALLPHRNIFRLLPSFPLPLPLPFLAGFLSFNSFFPLLPRFGLPLSYSIVISPSVHVIIHGD
ncbi:hypothetical protein LINGRAHAP2_LOCUS13248 [Linum grandiflorum]